MDLLSGCPSDLGLADGKHNHDGYSPLDHGSEKRWRKDRPIDHDSASRFDVLNCRPVLSRTGQRTARGTSVAGFQWTCRLPVRRLRWGPEIPTARSSALPCATTRLLSRFAASPWRSSASSFAPKLCYAV